MRIAMFRGYKRYGDMSSDLLDQAVPRLTLTSALLPAIQIEHPFATAPGGPPGSGASSPSGGHFLPLLQPKLTVETALAPVQIAPWGDPGETTYWPVIKGSGVALAALAAYGLYRLLRG